MTPSQRAASRRGLLRDPQDRQRGISYNALRLARTELQFANHAISTEIARHAPWITGRKVRLSPGHPRVDICDSYAAGGPYEKDLEILPLHPNCMCYYEDVLMPADEFTRNVRGWLDGQNNFLDDYQSWLGVQPVTEPLTAELSLVEALEFWLSVSGDGHGVALGVSAPP